MIWFLLIAALDAALFVWCWRSRQRRQGSWVTSPAIGNKYLFRVGGEPVACEVLKTNRKTAWVRHPGGNIIKRHLRKHGWQGVHT